MLLMIHELMTLAKSQSRQPQTEYKPVNLKIIASHIQQNFQEEVVKKKLAFEVTLPEDLPEINGDPEMVEQMFENLISNAIKYTPEGGRLGMTFGRETNETVRIVVSDNGIGIPKSDLPRLFTHFFRASNVQDVIGSGLGLTIVKEIVAKHSGQIQVESEEGIGTTVTIYFPAAPREPPQNKLLVAKGGLRQNTGR
jgi:signal transduction histidine kinase